MLADLFTRFPSSVRKRKLKAIYTYLEQLYTWVSYAIMAVKSATRPPQLIKDMLNDLSTVPQWIQELKKSTARASTGMVLACEKAFLPEMDPCEMVGGFPQFKIDGSEFSQEDFACCVKDTRVGVTRMVEELDLSKY